MLGVMMLKFVTDSSSDVIEIKGVNFATVPLKIYTSEKEYVDDDEIDTHEMLDYLLSYRGRSYTSCPSVDSWLTAFEGGTEIYVITITSFLSGSYNSACIAKETYLSEHPDAKIYIIDSLSTGPESRLILEKLIELKQSGMEYENVIKAIEAYKATTHLFFSFVSLHNFAQNGRINKAVATAVGILNINIVGTASDEGNIQPLTKCRGSKKAIIKLIEHMKEKGYKGGKVHICHVENEELGNEFMNAVKKQYPDAEIIVYPARGLCSYYAERGGIIIGCEC